MYQSGTIQAGGAAGYSFLCSPPVIAGNVVVKTGDVWIKFKKSATVTVSGANINVTDPSGAAYVDGWLHLTAGEVQEFGSEKLSDSTFVDPVVQIDVYCTAPSEVGIIAH